MDSIYRLKDLSPTERLSILEGDNADIEEGKYIKPLNDSETSIMQSEMVAVMIKRSMLEAEFDQVKKDYKDQLEPLKDQINSSLGNLKTRTQEVTSRIELS